MKPCAHGGTAWPPGAQDHAAATAGLGSRQENRLLSKSMETSQYPRKTTRTRNMTGRSLTPSPSQKKHSGASLRTPLASRPSANMIESPSSAKKVYAQIMATPGSTIKGPRLNSASAISTKVLVSPSMRSEKQGDGKGTNVLRCSSSNWSASRRPPRVQPSPAARVGAPPQRRPRTKLQTMQTGPWATSALEGLRRVQSRKELTKKAATKLQAVVRGNAARGIATRKWIEAQCVGVSQNHCNTSQPACHDILKIIIKSKNGKVKVLSRAFRHQLRARGHQRRPRPLGFSAQEGAYL
eukprot:scaffold255418_cov23-Tisochrysis_lutea.AAC.1